MRHLPEVFEPDGDGTATATLEADRQDGASEDSIRPDDLAARPYRLDLEVVAPNGSKVTFRSDPVTAPQALDLAGDIAFCTSTPRLTVTDCERGEVVLADVERFVKEAFKAPPGELERRAA